MRQLIKSLALATAMTFLAAGGVFAANVPESTDPIKVIKNDWTGQLFSTEVLGGLLQKMGYNIEYVSAGALPQHPGIAQGNLHVQTEVWTNNVGDLYPGLVDKGEIVVVGDLGLDPKEGWYIHPIWKQNVLGCLVIRHFMSVNRLCNSINFSKRASNNLSSRLGNALKRPGS